MLKIIGSIPRIIDLIYWPSIQILLWGFISKFFTYVSDFYNNTVGVILTAAILYDFLFRSSISYNIMFLEEIWSRNFTNLFITPIKKSEIIIINIDCNYKNTNRVSCIFICYSSFWSFHL